MRHLLTLPLPLLLLACGAPDVPCAGGDIDAWQLATNRHVATTSFPSDLCGRRSELVTDLLPGGEVTLSRTVAIPAGYVHPYVEINSGATAACVQIMVSLDAASHAGPVASFSPLSGNPTATIQATAQERCLVRLRPVVQIGNGP